MTTTAEREVVRKPLTRRTIAATILVLAGITTMIAGGTYAIRSNMQAWDEHVPDPAAAAARELTLLQRDLRATQSHLHGQPDLAESLANARQAIRRLTVHPVGDEIIAKLRETADQMDATSQLPDITPDLRAELTRQANVLRADAAAEVAANHARQAWQEYVAQHPQDSPGSVGWFAVFFASMVAGMGLIVAGTFKLS